MSIPAWLLSSKRRTLRQGERILRVTYHLYHNLLSSTHLIALVILLFLGIILNYEYNVVDWINFLIHKSLCIPMKYQAILVPFPLKRPIFVVKLLILWFKYETRLVIYTKTKNLIYHLVGRKHLMNNGYFRNIIKKITTLCVPHHA